MSKPKYPTFIVNDENIKNTYGFFINSSGGKFERFLQNPIMLDNHKNDTDSSIGFWENLTVKDGKIYLDPVFDLESEKGKKIGGQVERKVLRACSMGIVPNWQTAKRTGEDVVLMDWELVEVSIVAVPSNSGAVAVYSADGKMLTEQQVKELCLSIKTAPVPPVPPVPPVLNEFDFKNTLNSIYLELGLPSESNSETVLNKIKDLKSNSISLAAQNKELKNNLKFEIESLLDFAVSTGKINEDIKTFYLSESEKNYSDVRKKVLDLLPVQKQNFVLMLENFRAQKFGDDSKENRLLWTLEDWRKNDPNYLSSNPEFYQSLVDKEFKQS